MTMTMKKNNRCYMLKSIEIIVKSVKEISKDEQEYLSPENAVIICSSYGERFKKADRFNNWLVMDFADVENRDFPTAIKSEHAELVKKYVDSLDENIKRLYICCDRGLSRGPAMKAALLTYRHESDMIIWKNPYLNPNTLVYEILCQEFGVRFAHHRAIRRKKINDKALRKAIRSGKH